MVVVTRHDGWFVHCAKIGFALQCLAVDVSIWLVQFLKAMRDEDGKMIHNAHIVGVLRRVSKVWQRCPGAVSPSPLLSPDNEEIVLAALRVCCA